MVRTRPAAWLALLMLLVLALPTACRGEVAPTTSTASERGASTEASPEGADNDEAEVAQADAPSADRYPALMFGLLSAEQRTRFVGLAEAELCPCEGAPASLDACLQRTEGLCELALQAASIMMRLIQEGSDDVEVLDMAQQHVRNARRVHEFDVENTPWKGAEEPTVVIVEFADFQCPACREVGTVLASLLPEFESDVRVYFKHFPLPSHPNATPAAVASLAAHEQGQFWAYHDRIFGNQGRLNATDDPMPLLLQWADELGLDRDRFQSDMARPELRQRVQADVAAGTNAGLMGTPTLYLNGVMVMDAYNADALRARIRSAIATARAAE